MTKVAQEILDKYEAVIGLEVHAQLLTKSKMYANDNNEYGSMPNTNVSVVSLGHPGTLPMVNKSAIEYAVKMGLACNCNIREHNQFARKNYFYADLPKGYQVTQDDTPICTGGYVTIKSKEGIEKKINLTRIHMEEDSGKSIHDLDPFYSMVDLNRAGVPLIEIVTDPDLRSGEEAYNYLTEIRKLVRYLEICDGNMEEGSLRCDANISVRLKGAEEYGQRVEVKNMNSIRNVMRAINFEIERHIALIEEGKKDDIKQETRSFDAVKGTTFTMRTKEAADDYRYFTEPDLQPIKVSQDYIDEVKKNLPPLPQQLFAKYTKDLQLTEYDAGVLTDSKEIALFFEEVISSTNNYKAAANWVMGDIKSYLNEKALHIDDFPVTAVSISQLIKLVDEGTVSNSVASQSIFPALLENPSKAPEQIAEDLNLIQESDSGTLQQYIEQAIAAYPDKVAEYKSGKKGLMGLFMGEVMKLSKGKADPKVASKMLQESLKK